MADHVTMPKLPLMMRFKFFVGSFLLNRCLRSDGSINRRLLNFLDVKVPASSSTPVSTSDITVDPSRDLWFRLYTPSTTTSTEKLPLVIQFHGGGFSFFSADSKPCDDFCRVIAAAIPAVVASVNYRLAPEHKFPSQYDDAFDALKFINDSAGRGVLPPSADLRRCFLAGDSAGGNIAHHLAVRAGNALHMLDEITLAGIVAVQPFFGGEERTESEQRLAKAPVLTPEGADAHWRMFLPAGADRNHGAAHVLGGDEEEERRVRSVEYPRTLVVVGGLDPLQDWQRRYVKGLERCGKEVLLLYYPNAFHSFYAFQELPDFQLLLQDVTSFIAKR